MQRSAAAASAQQPQSNETSADEDDDSSGRRGGGGGGGGGDDTIARTLPRPSPAQRSSPTPSHGSSPHVVHHSLPNNTSNTATSATRDKSSNASSLSSAGGSSSSSSSGGNRENSQQDGSVATNSPPSHPVEANERNGRAESDSAVQGKKRHRSGTREDKQREGDGLQGDARRTGVPPGAATDTAPAAPPLPSSSLLSPPSSTSLSPASPTTQPPRHATFPTVTSAREKTALSCTSSSSHLAPSSLRSPTPLELTAIPQHRLPMHRPHQHPSRPARGDRDRDREEGNDGPGHSRLRDREDGVASERPSSPSPSQPAAQADALAARPSCERFTTPSHAEEEEGGSSGKSPRRLRFSGSADNDDDGGGGASRSRSQKDKAAVDAGPAVVAHAAPCGAAAAAAADKEGDTQDPVQLARASPSPEPVVPRRNSAHHKQYDGMTDDKRKDDDGDSEYTASPPPPCPDTRSAAAAAAAAQHAGTTTATPCSSPSPSLPHTPRSHTVMRHDRGSSRDASPALDLTAHGAAAAATRGSVLDRKHTSVFFPEGPPGGTSAVDGDGYALPTTAASRTPGCNTRPPPVLQQRTPPSLAQTSPSSQHAAHHLSHHSRAAAATVSTSPLQQHGGPPPSPLSRLASDSRAARAPCVPQIVPTHDSVFFPLGTDVIAPVLLHYATVGGWSTTAGGKDYFNHRRLRGGDVAGHTVRWLHTAQPRDRFVFLVTPVFNCQRKGGEDGEREDRTGSEAVATVHARFPLNDKREEVTQQQQKEKQQKDDTKKSKEGVAGRSWRQHPRDIAQRLRRCVFGDAPWFTQARPAAGPRSRIAVDESLLHLVSEEDGMEGEHSRSLTTPGTSGIYDPHPLSQQQHHHPQQSLSTTTATLLLNGSMSDDEGAGGGALRTPRGVSRPEERPMVMASPPRSQSAGMPCCMSPKLVVRLPSLGGTTPPQHQGQQYLDESVSAFLTPLSIGLAIPAVTNVGSAASAVKKEGGPSSTVAMPPPPPLPQLAACPPGRSLATPSVLAAPLFPVYPTASAPAMESSSTQLRRSVTPTESYLRLHASSSAGRYVFSPLTGTAVSTSGASPVTPHPPKLRGGGLPRRTTPPQQQQQVKSARSTTAAAAAVEGAAVPAAEVAGVEVIEIAHADITAMDYAPRLTSHRLSIEARDVYTYFFSSLTDALDYYGCPEALALMEEQWAAGMTSQLPRPQKPRPSTTQREERHHHHRQQQQQLRQSVQQRSASADSNSSSTAMSVRTASLTAQPAGEGESEPGLASLPPAALHKDNNNNNDKNESLPHAALSLSGALRSADSGERHVRAPTQLLRPGSCPVLDGSGSRWWEREGEWRARERRDRDGDPSALPPSPMAAFAAIQGTSQRSQSTHAAPLSMTLHNTDNNNSIGSSSGAHRSSRSAPAVPLSPSSQYQPVWRCLTSAHHEIVVSVYTADPVFSSILRELLTPEPGTHPYTASVADQKRLLSMVEVGMPAWAVFYSSTGLPYRRLFRLLYSGMTNLWPLLSLAVGVYDLYKHLPQLKRFMERTFDPLARWLERRFTLRFSVLATYLLSTVVTIFSSLSAFVSQFYVVQLLSLPIVQLVFALIKLPFVLAFDTVWLVTSTALSTVSLALQLVRVLVMAPVVFVVNIASLRETFGVVAPVAVQGTSLSVKWWKTWSEFWETVASPIKNAVRAWWDSMLHVSTTAARRETSIRRWYSPKAEQSSRVVDEVLDVLAINAQLWWSEFIHPGLRRLVLLAVALTYLYWLFLGISTKVWDDFIYASGVRHPSPVLHSAAVGAAAGTAGGDAAATVRHETDGLGVEQRQQQQDESDVAFPSTRDTNATRVTLPETAVTPTDAIQVLLFQVPSDVLAGLQTAPVTSTACAMRAQSPNTATSVILMCDRAGTSTIIVTTTTTTGAEATAGTEARGSMTIITTAAVPLPQAPLLSLTAELLLPNAVLELVHHLHHVLRGGWRAVARLKAGRRRRLQRQRAMARVLPSDPANETARNASELETDVCAATMVCVAAAHTADVADREETVSSTPPSDGAAVPYRMRTYAEESAALVVARPLSRAYLPQMLLTWEAVNLMKWGDTRGQQTPYELCVVEMPREDGEEAIDAVRPT